jgi:hypothetical protein
MSRAAFDLSRIELPDFGLAGGGYGSEIVPLGDTARVVVSLPSGGARCPWACVHLETGEVTAERGMRGEVRDGELDREGRGWLLTSSALVQVDVAETPRVLEVLAPRGLGRDQSRLLAMGDSRYGVCSWLGRALSVVDVRTSVTVKKIRVAAPHVSVLAEDTVTLYAPHAGRRVVLGRADLNRLEETEMPTGTRPCLEDGDLLMVLGRRKPIPHSKAWTVTRDALGIFDASTFEERVRAEVPVGARDVLGKDREGRVVISTDDGIALIDRTTLREIARVALPIAHGIRAHRFLGKHQAMVMIDQDEPSQLVVARW